MSPYYFVLFSVFISSFIPITCKSNNNNVTFHLGVQISTSLFPTNYTAEFNSVIRLAVELVNNKSDGWFDQELSNIHLVYRTDDPKCDFDSAKQITLAQSDWASGLKGRLDGVLGADCSGAR